MATKFANVKGVKWHEEPRGSEKGGVATITFDVSSVFTGGTDTVQLGGGGTDGGASTSLTLQQIMQNRRRDGKTVTILGALQGPHPGRQSGATNGPDIYPTSVTLSSGNVTCSLQSAYSSGSNITTLAQSFDSACSIVVTYTAA